MTKTENMFRMLLEIKRSREMQKRKQLIKDSIISRMILVEPQFKTKVVTADNKRVNAALEQLDEQINTMIDLTDKMVNWRRISRCNICGKYEAPQSFVVRHIEANHITGVSHSCEICRKSRHSDDGEDVDDVGHGEECCVCV